MRAGFSTQAQAPRKNRPLSMDRYEHLVAELTRAKHAIERAFRDAVE